jgi:hypothetical protein
MTHFGCRHTGHGCIRLHVAGDHRSYGYNCAVADRHTGENYHIAEDHDVVADYNRGRLDRCFQHTHIAPVHGVPVREDGRKPSQVGPGPYADRRSAVNTDAGQDMRTIANHKFALGFGFVLPAHPYIPLNVNAGAYAHPQTGRVIETSVNPRVVADFHTFGTRE